MGGLGLRTVHLDLVLPIGPLDEVFCGEIACRDDLGALLFLEKVG
jgi:hypothetical protein